MSTEREQSRCDACDDVIEPIALFHGSTPGRSCKCGWESLRRCDFRRLFGFHFQRAGGFKGPGFEGVATDSYVFMQQKRYSGNAHQRRKQMRSA